MAFLISEGRPVASQKERTAAFIEAMNKKAAEIGMRDSVFTTPSGQGITSHTSASDLLALLIEAAKSEIIRGIWGKKLHKFSVGGAMAREIELITTVKQEALESEYEIIGGKTGMWTCDGYDQHNLVMIAKGRRSGRIFAGVILGADSPDGRFSAMHELFRVGDGYDSEVKRAVSATVAELGADFKPLGEVIYKKNAEREHIPASTAKVLSIVTALGYLKDSGATVELEAQDIQGGSGAKHFEGDTLTVGEILYSMLLPSSNTCAYALASTVGAIILKN